MPTLSYILPRSKLSPTSAGLKDSLHVQSTPPSERTGALSPLGFLGCSSSFITHPRRLEIQASNYCTAACPSRNPSCRPVWPLHPKALRGGSRRNYLFVRIRVSSGPPKGSNSTRRGIVWVGASHQRAKRDSCVSRSIEPEPSPKHLMPPLGEAHRRVHRNVHKQRNPTSRRM